MLPLIAPQTIRKFHPENIMTLTKFNYALRTYQRKSQRLSYSYPMSQSSWQMLHNLFRRQQKYSLKSEEPLREESYILESTTNTHWIHLFGLKIQNMPLLMSSHLAWIMQFDKVRDKLQLCSLLLKLSIKEYLITKTIFISQLLRKFGLSQIIQKSCDYQSAVAM